LPPSARTIMRSILSMPRLKGSVNRAQLF